MEKQMNWRMWIQLIEVRLRFVGLLILTGIIVGYWDSLTNYWERFTRSASTPSTILQEIVEYFCAMHPQIVRAEPGNCPICGMPLIKRAKGISAPLPPEVTGRITLSPYRIALAGIQTHKVDYQPLIREVETLGEVELDERKLARISARFSGRIERLFVNFTGTGVKAGEPLVELYSPVLITTFEELLSNARKGQNLDGFTAAIKRKLLYWGIENDQIDQVVKTGIVPDRFSIRSSLSGIITKKSIVEGQYVEEGAPLFEAADLNILWLISKVYEDDLAFVKVGQTTNFETVSYPGVTFAGTVAYIDPIIERETRTAKVRIDIENISMKLRPGMYGNVKIRVPVSSIPDFQAAFQPYIGSASKLIFTCSMHPEVQQTDPGKCPKCNMTLIEKRISESPQETLEYICPMHPDVKSDKPGKCRLCAPYMDMDLEPHGKALAPRRILAVPETAVIDTGRRKIVYVETAPGLFEGRIVQLGPRAEIYYPVLSGLKADDIVVSHGSFLIDAETRLNPAAGNPEPKETSKTVETDTMEKSKSSADHSGHGN